MKLDELTHLYERLSSEERDELLQGLWSGQDAPGWGYHRLVESIAGA
jgi:hypothetical protein